MTDSSTAYSKTRASVVKTVHFMFSSHSTSTPTAVSSFSGTCATRKQCPQAGRLVVVSSIRYCFVALCKQCSGWLSLAVAASARRRLMRRLVARNIRFNVRAIAAETTRRHISRLARVMRFRCRLTRCRHELLVAAMYNLLRIVAAMYDLLRIVPSKVALCPPPPSTPKLFWLQVAQYFLMYSLQQLAFWS